MFILVLPVNLLVVLKAYKYRLCPTKAQKLLLEKHFGCIRLIYNIALETKQYTYISQGASLLYGDLTKQLTELKAENAFFKEVNSQSLQQALRNLDAAYKNFFKYGSGFPKFKSKYSKQSFGCPQHSRIDFSKGLLYLVKFKEGIPIILHRKFKGDIKTVTITKTPSGKYFASVLVDNHKDVPQKKAIKSNTAIGIDLGITSYLTLSDGAKFENPKYLKASLDKLKYLQRSFSRKQKGSNRREKARLKVARQHEKISNQRNDFLHKVSDAITKQYDTVCIEDLNVKGMSSRCKPKQDEDEKYLPNGQSAKRGLNRSIHDAAWSNFVRMLEYKSEWRGKNLLKIGKFEPSTKKCNNCGDVNQSLTLKDREWVCANCGVLHDRDENAAVNIKLIALKDWRTERACQDAEASGYRAVEASKIQDDVSVLSDSF